VGAKIRPRIDMENRTPLEKVIPLSTPFVLFVDPSDRCNFQCKFCPTGDRRLMERTPGRNHGNMDFALFKKIVDDLCEFERPIKVLRLYKDGEPLMNPMLSDMIRYAKDKGCVERIDTTTNASLLTKRKALDLIEAGLDRINISVIGVKESQYVNFCNYKIKLEEFVETIGFLYENRRGCEVIIKINGDILSDDDKAKFLDMFGDKADGVFIEHVMECWPGFKLRGVRANEEVGIYGQPIKEVVVCPYVFYSLSVNSDGTVSLCFLDWSRKLIIGDVRRQGVKDIWEGQELRNYQVMFLRKRRKELLLCRNCGQLTHGMPDDIDQFADAILRRLGVE